MSNDETLQELLHGTEYALGLSPGFFCFYAQLGIVHALHEASILHPTHISGASAGALVGGFLASGMSIDHMVSPVLRLNRSDMWDLGGIGGLLRGNKFQAILENHLPIDDIKDCNIPFGATAYDILRCRTNCITAGKLATTIRASCTFPGLFQPVLIENSPHIDGGIFDFNGLMALPGIPSTNLIVNILCSSSQLSSSVPSQKYPNARVISIVMENIPGVTPFTMSSAGPRAYAIAKAAMLHAVLYASFIKLSNTHHLFIVDGSIVDPEMCVSVLTKRKFHDTEDEDVEQQQQHQQQQHEQSVVHKENVADDVKVEDTGVTEGTVGAAACEPSDGIVVKSEMKNEEIPQDVEPLSTAMLIPESPVTTRVRPDRRGLSLGAVSIRTQTESISTPSPSSAKTKTVGARNSLSASISTVVKIVKEESAVTLTRPVRKCRKL